jgi:hypothetical protein
MCFNFQQSWLEIDKLNHFILVIENWPNDACFGCEETKENIIYHFPLVNAYCLKVISSLRNKAFFKKILILIDSNHAIKISYGQVTIQKFF